MDVVDLKILRVSERILPMPGGKEIHVAELTQEQALLGHDIHVIYRFGDGLLQGGSSTRVHLPRPLASLRGGRGTAMFGYLSSKLAAHRNRPDVLHVHGDFIDAWPLARYAQAAGVPMILTVHGRLNPRYTRLAGIAFRQIDHFIALGDPVKSDLLTCGVPKVRITTMSSGLNTKLLDAAGRVKRREPGLIVMTGSLDPVKNIYFVISALARMPASLDFRLDVIGEGPQRQELEALAASVPRVRFLGQLTRAEVYDRVSDADIFVMASRRTKTKGEGVPTALLEAMALGKLCLVSKEALPHPVVTDADSYWTFDPHDQGDLARLVQHGLGHEHARVQAGERARSAVSHLSWPQIAKRVESVYERAQDCRLGHG